MADTFGSNASNVVQGFRDFLTPERVFQGALGSELRGINPLFRPSVRRAAGRGFAGRQGAGVDESGQDYLDFLAAQGGRVLQRR